MTYRVESVVLFEAVFEDGRLVLGEPELLSRGLTVLFIADASGTVSVDVEIFAIGLSLASLPAHARHRAVRGRHVLAVGRRR